MLHTTNTLRQTIINGSKKITFIIALFLTVGISSSFATPNDDLKDVVKTSFRKDFKKAELMSYEVSKQYTKLTLKLNDVVLFAFYADNGDLLAVSRNIRTNQLPIQLLLELKKNYNSDYWVTDLFEINSDGQHSYYVTMENENTKTTLRSSGSNSWETYEKTIKK
ncbi:MAG TPA: hypothetical protein VGM30_25105 [Puia sp.]|jgi:hypothetical protein